MPQVRILSLRPKKQERGSSSLLFFACRVDSKLFCEAKCRFAFPARRSTSSLVRRRAWESRSVVKLPCHSDQNLCFMHQKISPFRKIRTVFRLLYPTCSFTKRPQFLAKRFLSAQDTGFVCFYKHFWSVFGKFLFFAWYNISIVLY